ncbi:adenine deaminase C-terminal domain-containing protein [Pseudonocardia acaciae]|uniref:adenine deaminase C-terminal domain-containing protein n=1 Tax=Pseudonocardia acaciae TaxID=551276 RepID=UPI000490C6A7|nr:adenine deaminase C-terminal domain-containing protein [Pseudonocardia acaciae]
MNGRYWDAGVDRDHVIAVALGERPADLVIRGGRLVDVHTGEIYPAGVAVAGGRIASVGEVEHLLGPDTTVVDAAGRYLVPGFVDSHVHIGASALAMTEFARLVVPLGTAAVVTDFYEPATMAGVAAMRFLLDETARTPLRVFLSPFCPAFGAPRDLERIDPDEFAEVLDWPECVEVREWYLSREHRGDPAERRIGRLAREKGVILSGHLAGLSGPPLRACVAAGIRSDHEARTAAEAIERARLGVAVQMRWSSGIREDMAELLTAITRHRLDSRLFMFSTDEEDVDEIADLGHLDHRVRAAVAAGVAPVDAIRMASLNAATFLGVAGELGSVTPGRLAFVNLVEDLADMRVSAVVAGPRVVGEHGRYVADLPSEVTYPADFHDTVRVGRELATADFAVAAPDGRATVTVRAIGLGAGSPRWKERLLDMPVVGGAVPADPGRDVAKVAVIERHRATGRSAVGFLQGFGMRRGAFGSSFNPVALNIGVVGADDADMALVANRISELGGGFVAALDGRVLAEAPLPILGFLSAAPAPEVAAAFRAVRSAIADRLGCALPGLYTTFGFLLLPVGPGLHIVADGLVRVDYGEDTVRTPLPVLVG